MQLTEKGASISVTFDTGNFMYNHLKDVTANTLQMTLLGEGGISVKEVLNVFLKDIHTAIGYRCGSKPLEVLKKKIDKLVEIKLEIESTLK